MNTSELSTAFQCIERNQSQYFFEITVEECNEPVKIYVDFDPDHENGTYFISCGGYRGEEDQGFKNFEGKIKGSEDFFVRALVLARAQACRYGQITKINYVPELGQQGLDIPLDAKAKDFALANIAA